MGKTLRVFAVWGSWLLVCVGLAACSSKRQTAPQLAAVRTAPTVTLTLVAAVTDPAPLATETPQPPLAPTATQTLPPPTPSPIPPTITRAPTPLACITKPGRIEDGYLTPSYLPRWLLYRVYLPPCYDDLPDRRYPVLFLIHGQSYTENQWVRLGVPDTADALIASGDIPPFIVVMPGDRVWTQPSQDLFGKALVEALIPAIDARYRTLPDRQHRAIGGLSRGAAWAVHLGLSQWEMFGAIGAHSLPVFWEDVPEIQTWIDQIPIDEFPRIYMDIGDHDRPEVMNSALWFEQLLTDQGIPHEWHLFSGAHDETYWKSHVEQYLRWYAANW